MDRTDRMRKKQTRIYRNQQEQTGIDRIISDIENYCIIKKFIYQIGISEVKENPTEKKRDGRKKKKKKKKKKQFLRLLRIAVKKKLTLVGHF